MTAPPDRLRAAALVFCLNEYEDAMIHVRGWPDWKERGPAAWRAFVPGYRLEIMDAAVEAGIWTPPAPQP